MNQQTLHDRLYAALKDRNIPCDREDVKTALQDPGTARWVENNIRPETLLSKEELRLYDHLESTASLATVLQSPHLPSTRPLLDHEIASAIEALQSSTTAIDAQTEVLNAQCKELRIVLNKEGRNAARREKVLERFRGKNVGEAETVNAQVDELSQEFATRLEKTLVLLEAENKALAPGVAGMLREHDRMLQEFEELASRLEDDGDDGLEERAAKLSTQLGGFLAEEIHCRLDRLYLECIAEGSNVRNVQREVRDQEDQIAGLEEEISSLYSEIDVLAQMASQERFQGRVSQALRHKRELADSTSGRQLDHILNTMARLTILTERLSERIQTRQSHTLAVKALANAEQRARPSPRPTAPKHQSRHSISVLGMHKEANHRRSSSIPHHYQHQQPSLETILRRFNISLPALLKSSSAAPTILESKKESMLQILADHYAATPSPLVPYLEEADKMAQLLASSLYSGPQFPTPEGGGERGRTLTQLEVQLEVLRKKIEGVDFDAESLKRDPEKERFLERWG